MDPYIGEIRMFAGPYAPQGWHYCDGTVLPINNNEVLFSILGRTYGGDGATNFALPNLNGRVAIGAGQNPTGSNYTIAQAGGVTDVAITSEAMLPQHTHSLCATTSNATTGDPTNAILAASAPGTGYSDVKFYSSLPQGMQAPNATLEAPTIGNTGGNQTHSNMQPYMVISYIICMQGLYPSPQ